MVLSFKRTHNPGSNSVSVDFSLHVDCSAKGIRRAQLVEVEKRSLHMSKHQLDSAYILAMSDQQPAACNCSRRGCGNTLLPMAGAKCVLIIVSREKEKQRKKRACAVIKRTRDDDGLSGAPLRGLRYARTMLQIPHLQKRPEVCINQYPRVSFKGHPLQLGSLHLVTPIWLVYSVSSSHKSRPPHLSSNEKFRQTTFLNTL